MRRRRRSLIHAILPLFVAAIRHSDRRDLLLSHRQGAPHQSGQPQRNPQFPLAQFGTVPLGQPATHGPGPDGTRSVVLTAAPGVCHLRANLPQLTGFGPHLSFTAAAVLLSSVFCSAHRQGKIAAHKRSAGAPLCAANGRYGSCMPFKTLSVAICLLRPGSTARLAHQ